MLVDPMAKRTSPPAKETERKESDPGPMKTKTLPEAMQGGWFEGNDVVTALEIYGTGVTFELPRDRKTFTIGASADRDIALPDKFLSALHCVLERRGTGLRVHDQGSYNGTTSWFKNCAAAASANYGVRSSDGEVTQYVAEQDVASTA